MLTFVVTDITLITPRESAAPLENALAQNPHLTGLPAPRPEVLAPKELTQTTGTGEIFRLPEVQNAITGDFIVLPCDLICELEGSSLLQSWMVLQSGLGGATGGIFNGTAEQMGSGGEKSGRRGGLGVWYPTKGLEGVSTKGEETDFIATTPLPPSTVPSPEGSIRRDIQKLVLSIPTSTVKDITEDEKSFPIRHALLKKHGKIKMKTSHRDAHIYFFPYWIKDMMRVNEGFDSVAEDVLGWWAKAEWQDGLGDKLGLREILEDGTNTPDAEDMMMASSMQLEEDVDLAAMSSTTSRSTVTAVPTRGSTELFASRVTGSLRPDINVTPATPDVGVYPEKQLTIPPILAYVQPAQSEISTQSLIRRVDTSALLLSISLRLAKLPSIAEANAAGTQVSPYAHQSKVAHPDMVQAQSRISEVDSLVAQNVTIASRVNIKESVVGVNCTIGQGSRLTRCLLMEGAVVGDFVTLTGCILGRRCKVEGGAPKDEDKTRLTDCEVQGGFVVEWGSKFFHFLSECLRITTNSLPQLRRRMRNSWSLKA